MPKSDEAIIDLAEQLYSPEGRDSISDEESEYLYGTLFAALSNPEIEDSTVEAVLSAADADMPSLPNTYTSGHFKLYYTTNDSDPDNNVTLNDIKSTAAVLNNAWNDYSVNFKEPKHYLDNGKKWIDVYVYYLGSSKRGVTSSSWNYIELNSITVVSDPCRRQTTPVHELFHRVQYQYGYISGTAGMSWCVEGTASWSQKYMAPHVGDWMPRMNDGIDDPDYPLMDRSYDACHFWCYLGQRAGNEQAFIEEVWANFEVNGKDLKDAVDSAIKSMIKSSYNLDIMATQWLFTNASKDYINVSSVFDYEEDEWVLDCGTETYGPLFYAPRTAKILKLDDQLNWNNV